MSPALFNQALRFSMAPQLQEPEPAAGLFPALADIRAIGKRQQDALQAFEEAQRQELALDRPTQNFNLTDAAILGLGLLFGGRERGDFVRGFTQGKMGGFQQRLADFDAARRERLSALESQARLGQGALGAELDSARDALRSQQSEFEWNRREAIERMKQDATTGRTEATIEGRRDIADMTEDRTRWKSQYDGFARIANNPNLPAEVRSAAATRMMDMVGVDPELAKPLTEQKPSVPEQTVAIRAKESDARVKKILAEIPLTEARRKYVEKQIANFDEKVGADIAFKWAQIDNIKRDNARSDRKMSADEARVSSIELRETMKTASTQSNALRRAIESANKRLGEAKKEEDKARIREEISEYQSALQTYRDLYTGAVQALQVLPKEQVASQPGEVAPILLNPPSQGGIRDILDISTPGIAGPMGPRSVTPRQTLQAKSKPKAQGKSAPKSKAKSFQDKLKELGWTVEGGG